MAMPAAVSPAAAFHEHFPGTLLLQYRSHRVHITLDVRQDQIMATFTGGGKTLVRAYEGLVVNTPGNFDAGPMYELQAESLLDGECDGTAVETLRVRFTSWIHPMPTYDHGAARLSFTTDRHTGCCTSFGIGAPSTMGSEFGRADLTWSHHAQTRDAQPKSIPQV